MTKKPVHSFESSRLLDVFAITASGILLLKYWLTEKLVLRFVITHCAIDTTLMGLPVKLTTSRKSIAAYKFP